MPQPKFLKDKQDNQSQQPDKPKRTRLEYIVGHFDAAREQGDGYMVRCPIHDDNNPSVSIREENGKILLHCFGCHANYAHILEAVGLRRSILFPDTPYPVAEYDYTDENGNLLYQSVRMYPKKFRQRKPKEGGGWEEGKGAVKDVRKVLYRLPELVAALLETPVFIVEGEKDVDRLRELGLVATTNSGGAKKPWEPEYTETLKGRRVALLPDNDTPGRAHCHDIASRLVGVADWVKIVELPDLPEKGDVSDWLDQGHTKQELFAVVKNTPALPPNALRTLRVAGNPTDNPTGQNPLGSHPTGHPKSHENKHETNPTGTLRVEENTNPLGLLGVGLRFEPVVPFPVDVFPEKLQHHLNSISEALPCPVDFPAVMILPILGAQIGTKAKAQVKEGWTEYPLLWTAVVSTSGDKKTPAFETLMLPVKRRQKLLLDQYLDEYGEWEKNEERKESEKPKLRQALTTDSTIEALKDVLDVNPQGILFPVDELTGWVRSIGQYKGGRGDDRQHWLSIWSSQMFVVNRKGKPALIIDDPFVAVTGGIQPDILDTIIDSGREDGFAARVLFSYPQQHLDKSWSEQVIEGGESYQRICDSLFEFEPLAKPIPFSPEAKALWIEWYNKHVQEDPDQNLKPTWAKLQGHCARFALILHLTHRACNETQETEIDSASMEGAIRLVDYFKSHAIRVYSTAAITQDTGRIGKAIDWIKRQGGEVTARKARQNGFTKTSEEAAELFRDLEEMGYGYVTEGKQNSVAFTLTFGTNPTHPTGQPETLQNKEQDVENTTQRVTLRNPTGHPTNREESPLTKKLREMLRDSYGVETLQEYRQVFYDRYGMTPEDYAEARWGSRRKD